MIPTDRHVDLDRSSSMACCWDRVVRVVLFGYAGAMLPALDEAGCFCPIGRPDEVKRCESC